MEKPSKGSTLSFAQAVGVLGGSMLPRKCEQQLAYGKKCEVQLAVLPADKDQGFAVICLRCDHGMDFPLIAKARS